MKVNEYMYLRYVGSLNGINQSGNGIRFHFDKGKICRKPIPKDCASHIMENLPEQFAVVSKTEYLAEYPELSPVKPIDGDIKVGFEPDKKEEKKEKKKEKNVPRGTFDRKKFDEFLKETEDESSSTPE